MIENKLYMKFLSLNKLAARLSSLNNMDGWSYTSPENSGIFSGYSLSSFFNNEREDADENAGISSVDHLSGLNSTFLSFRGYIKNISERLTGFNLKSENKTDADKPVIQNIYKNPVTGLELFYNKTDRKETTHHFREVATLLQNSYERKEKLLETESFKKITFPERVPQEKPSYAIHQTFGDIIVQPGSMDVSMQQLKVKIQDILKQARDSVY